MGFHTELCPVSHWSLWLKKQSSVWSQSSDLESYRSSVLFQTWDCGRWTAHGCVTVERRYICHFFPSSSGENSEWGACHSQKQADSYSPSLFPSFTLTLSLSLFTCVDFQLKHTNLFISTLNWKRATINFCEWCKRAVHSALLNKGSPCCYVVF